MLTDFSNLLTDIRFNMSGSMLERVMQTAQEAQPKRQEAEAASLQVALNKAELAKAESLANQMSAKARRAAEAEVKRHQKAWAYVTGAKTSPAYQKAFDRIPSKRQDAWRKMWKNRLASRRRYRENLLDLRPYNMAVSPGQQLDLVVWGLEKGKMGQLMLLNAQGNLVKAPGFNQKVKNGNVSVTFPDDLPDDEYAMQLLQKIEGSDIVTAAKNFPITVKKSLDKLVALELLGDDHQEGKSVRFRTTAPKGTEVEIRFGRVGDALDDKNPIRFLANGQPYEDGMRLLVGDYLLVAKYTLLGEDAEKEVSVSVAPKSSRVFELEHGFGLHVPASTPPNDVLICTITGPAFATLRVECVQGDKVQIDPNADQLDPYGRIGASFITPASGEYLIRITRTDVEPPQIMEQSLFVEGSEAAPHIDSQDMKAKKLEPEATSTK